MIAERLAETLNTLSDHVATAPEPSTSELCEALLEWLGAAKEVLDTDNLTSVDTLDIMATKIQRLKVSFDFFVVDVIKPVNCCRSLKASNLFTLKRITQSSMHTTHRTVALLKPLTSTSSLFGLRFFGVKFYTQGGKQVEKTLTECLRVLCERADVLSQWLHDVKGVEVTINAALAHLAEPEEHRTLDESQVELTHDLHSMTTVFRNCMKSCKRRCINCRRLNL